MSLPVRCRLKSIGVIRVGGTDARAFLHAQTTQNIAALAENQSTLAAWLTAKGRVRALFDVIATGDAFYLLLPEDQIEPLCRQLRMFVLRSDVVLEPQPDVVVGALVGDSSDWLRDHGIDLSTRTENANYRPACAVDRLTFVEVGTGLVFVLGDAVEIDTRIADIERGDADDADLAAIRLGRPKVPRALSEEFIPQMLNLDVLDAVSFTKGCYPGQEIVARTKNLGAVKRRLVRFRVGEGARPEPGDEILTGSDRIGEVNRAAATESGYELLAVVQLESLDGELSLAADGRALELAGT